MSQFKGLYHQYLQKHLCGLDLDENIASWTEERRLWKYFCLVKSSSSLLTFLPLSFVGTRGVSVFHHYCVIWERIIWKFNIFAKKLLWLGASHGNIHESRITVKDKTKTCQEKETHFLHTSGCANMYDVHDVHRNGYNSYRKSNVFIHHCAV